MKLRTNPERWRAVTTSSRKRQDDELRSDVIPRISGFAKVKSSPNLIEAMLAVRERAQARELAATKLRAWHYKISVLAESLKQGEPWALSLFDHQLSEDQIADLAQAMESAKNVVTHLVSLDGFYDELSEGQMEEMLQHLRASFHWVQLPRDAWSPATLDAGLRRPPVLSIAKDCPRVRRTRSRKPRCELGGFFSGEKANLRNAP